MVCIDAQDVPRRFLVGASSGAAQGALRQSRSSVRNALLSPGTTGQPPKSDHCLFCPSTTLECWTLTPLTLLQLSSVMEKEWKLLIIALMFTLYALATQETFYLYTSYFLGPEKGPGFSCIDASESWSETRQWTASAGLTRPPFESAHTEYRGLHASWRDFSHDKGLALAAPLTSVSRKWTLRSTSVYTTL
jgi:hypothetical protein